MTFFPLLLLFYRVTIHYLSRVTLSIKRRPKRRRNYWHWINWILDCIWSILGFSHSWKINRWSLKFWSFIFFLNSWVSFYNITFCFILLFMERILTLILKRKALIGKLLFLLFYFKRLILIIFLVSQYFYLLIFRDKSNW